MTDIQKIIEKAQKGGYDICDVVFEYHPNNNDIEFVKKELIDTLWEAVKHKLNEY